MNDIKIEYSSHFHMWIFTLIAQEWFRCFHVPNKNLEESNYHLVIRSDLGRTLLIRTTSLQRTCFEVNRDGARVVWNVKH